jgi:hypothetical protein
MVSNKKMAAYDGIVSIKHSSNLNHNPNIGRCKEIDNDDEKDEGEKEIHCPLVNPLTEGKTVSLLLF